MRSNSKSNATAGVAEVARLRQQLIHAKSQISDLQEELQEQNNLYLSAIKERDIASEKLQNAKDSVNRFEQLVKAQVDRALEKERRVFETTRLENEQLKEQVFALRQENEQLKEEKQAPQYALNTVGDDSFQDAGLTYASKKAEKLRDDLKKKDRELTDIRKHVNYLQETVQDFMAENKVLREKVGAPANFGIDREKVRLLDQEKIDDFKKLIRVLQEDNYRLEEERAKLKHMIKQHAMLLNNNDPDHRYKKFNLNEEQISRVDEFVLNLVNGMANEPSDFYALRKENEKLKAQMEALSEKGFDYIKDQMEQLFREMGEKEHSKGGLNPQQFQTLNDHYEELRKRVEQLLVNGLNNTSAHSGRRSHRTMTGGEMTMQPPALIPNQDGTITNAFSYKFDQVVPINGPLIIPGFTQNFTIGPNITRQIQQAKTGYINPQQLSAVNGAQLPSLNLTDGFKIMADQPIQVENAFLQAQLFECFEINSKKDDLLKAYKLEIDNLYSRIKKYIFMQDHLYNDYTRMEKDHGQYVDRLKTEARDAIEALKAEQTQNQKLQSLLNSLRSDIDQDTKSRLIELTKQNSLFEVNIIKLTRKYQTLEEQEALLRRNYKSVEAEMAEMEVSCMERISSLKEWKRNATFQMKQMYNQLRVAYPLADYQAMAKELEILKSRNGDLIARNAQSTLEMSESQKQQREMHDAIKYQRELKESNEDLQKEYEIVRSRLEKLDPAYQWENLIFSKIVEKLKRTRISVTQAFQKFDIDHSGMLGRREMVDVLLALQLDLSNQETDILFNSIDLDRSGMISLKEFKRKLARHGLKELSSEELFMFSVLNALKMLRLNKTDMFSFFNKSQDGLITRQDFRDALTQLRISDVSKDDIEKFINYIYQDQKGGIDLRTFIRIFDEFERKMDTENTKIGTKLHRKKRTALPRKLIKRKKEIYEMIRFALEQTKVNLRQVFRKVDDDDSNQIELREFGLMFKSMEIKLDQAEVKDFFDSIDIDKSGQIQFAEFQIDYERYCKKTLSELEEEEQIMTSNVEETLDGGNNKTFGGQSNYGAIGAMGALKELELERKVATLEDRLKRAKLELENEQALRNLHEESYKLLERHHKDLKKQFDITRDEYFRIQEKMKTQEKKLGTSISQDYAEQIQRNNDVLWVELTETRSALNNYKNIYKTVCDQVKALKLMHERNKDEGEQLLQTLRDVQAETFDKQRFGKMYYVVMLSRWQEAAVNKKFDVKLSECNSLKSEVLTLAAELNAMEKNYQSAEVELQQAKALLQQTRQELAGSKNIFLTMSQAEEFDRIIKIISEERYSLEANYFKVRSECVSALSMLDEFRIKSEEKEKLLQELKVLKQSELSDKLISLSDKLQNLRISALKADRKSNDLEERVNYIEKLLSNKNKDMNELDQKFAAMERDIIRKEEQWRLADNERMRQFFAFKLGQEADNDKVKRTLGKEKMSANQFNNNFAVQKDSGRELTGLEKQAKINEQDDKIDELSAQIVKLQQEITYRDQRLNNIFQQQQTDMQIMMAGGSSGDQNQLGMNDLLADQRVKFQHLHDQESKEMADAAYQTIKTLNDMLEVKKTQLKSKDEQIDKLRKQLLDQRDVYSKQILDLNNQLSDFAKKDLSHSHQIIQGNNFSPERDMSNKQIRKFQADLEKSMKELEHLQSINQRQQEEMDDLRQQLTAERKAGLSQKEHFERIVKQLEEKVRIANERREKLARTRVEKNEKVILQFQKQMTDYETEIMKLKDKNEVLRLKAMADRNLSNIPPANAPVEEVKEENKNLTPTEKLERQILDLQNRLKMRDQELVKEKENKLKIKKEKDDVLQKMNEAEQKLADEKAKVLKYLKDKDQAQQALRGARQQAEDEKREKERYKDDLRNQISRQNNSNVMSYSEMEEKIKQMENDKFILQSQTKTVVVVNPNTQGYEYIGDPVFLNKDGELKEFLTILQHIQIWIARPPNDRLTIPQIFMNFDLHHSGIVSKDNLTRIFAKLGILLRPGELQLVESALDRNGTGLLEYIPLIRELLGVPQLDFMNQSVNKLARIVEKRDITQTTFKNELIDPTGLTMMTYEEFNKAMNECKADDFDFAEEEILSIFKVVAGVKSRTAGVKLSVDKLSQTVFLSLNALLIDQIRVSLEKNGLQISQLFSKYDKQKKGYLDGNDFNSILLDCQLKLQANTLSYLVNQVLDSRTGKKVNTLSASKITQSILKFYFEPFGAFEVKAPSLKKKVETISENNYGDLAHGSQEKNNLSQDALFTCQLASRKILLKLNKQLSELISGLDHQDEGIISKAELQSKIQDQKVSDLDNNELATLLKYFDKSSRGFISASKFLSQLYLMAADSEMDIVLRKIGQYANANNLNLKKEMLNLDSDGQGKLDKTAIKQLAKIAQVGVSENDLTQILKQLGHEVKISQERDSEEKKERTKSKSVSFAKKIQQSVEKVDINLLLSRISTLAKTKPLPSYIIQAGNKSSNSGAAGQGGDYETEVKFKKYISALKQEVEERQQEIETLRRDLKECHENNRRLEEKKRLLESRVVDANAKPSKGTENEAMVFSQSQDIIKLKDQLVQKQEENLKLRKTMDVVVKTEMMRIQKENKKLDEKLKQTSDERDKLENKINKILSRQMDGLERREELELIKEMKIQELNDKLHQQDEQIKQLDDELLKASEKLLEYKFERETYRR